METGKEVRRFEGHKSQVNSVAITPDGRYALSGSEDHTLRLWEIHFSRKETDKSRPYLFSFLRSFHQLALEKKEAWRLLKSAEDEIQRGMFSEAYVLLSKARAVPGYEWDRTMMDLAHACGVNGKARRTGLKGGWHWRTFEGYTSTVTSVAITPDGRYALSGSEDHTLRLWEIGTGKEVRRFKGRAGRLNSVAITPDGRHALSGSGDGLCLWEIETGRQVSFERHISTVYSVAITPDGRYALWGSGDNTLRLREIWTGKEVCRFEGHKFYVRFIAITPDGRYALSTSDSLRLWEIWTGKEVCRFEGHTNFETSVAITPDGRYALSGSLDKTLRLWEIGTGKEVRRFEGHTDQVNSVVITPDGRYALSGSGRDYASKDNTLRLWEIETGKEVRRFEGHTKALYCVAITPDGRFALSGSGSFYDNKENTLHLWEYDWEWEFPET